MDAQAWRSGIPARTAIPQAFSDPTRRPRVAFVRALTAGLFLERYQTGARAMAGQLGLELSERDAHGDQAALAALVWEEAQAGASVVVVHHADPAAVRPALDEALKLGVKVVAVDTQVDHPGVPEVEQDDLLIGHLLSGRLARDGAGMARVILVTADLNAPLAKRERAWEHHKWRHAGIVELARVTASSPELSRDLLAKALRAHPETTAVVALWEGFAHGASLAVREAGMAGQVAVYGTGMTDEDLLLMIEPGSPFAVTVGADPFVMGGVAARAAAALIAGEHLDKYLLLQPVLVTRAHLLGNRARRVDDLVDSMPSLGESPLAFFPWMDLLIERQAVAHPAARLPPRQLAGQLRLTLAALEVRNAELQSAALAIREAHADLERRVQERTAELSLANARLAASGAYLDRIINAVVAPIFVKDRQHRFVLVNDALCAMMGRSRASLLGKSDLDVLPPDEAGGFLARDEAVFATGAEGEGEERLTDAQGVTHQVVTRRALYRNDAGALFVVGVLDDVTERKRLEEQLRQSQKMETVGLLAGGIAHDFNNLLTPVLGYSELLSEGLEQGHPDRELLEAIHEAASRARDLTRRLLSFSRKQVMVLELLDVGALVHRFESMLRRTIRESIRIELTLPERVPAVRADRAQIEQVLLNLSVNAQDAMLEGGLFRIALGAVPTRELPPADRPKEARDTCVVITVSDTGTGMDERTLERAFEPFFTTKGPGHGTGLGLSTVYGIVQQHGGTISIRSRSGEGTEFRIVSAGRGGRSGQGTGG